VVGDPALLVQLIGALVSNVLDHTPVSAPTTLSATREAGWAVIMVADRGPGLEAEAAARVFDRFWRGQTSRSRTKRADQVGGAGLGLSIARSITDAHRGVIALATSPGEGCTFTVRLPMDRGGGGAAANPSD
jgi:two-component system OmpR family sensor kinase